MKYRIGTFQKLALFFRVLRLSFKIPVLKKKISYAICPLESTRYVEFAYSLCCIDRYGIQTSKTLDVSSPFMLAYLLSGFGEVVKTDINNDERRYIRESNNLSFKKEDATRMSFADASFDFVYSISVIEHIYEAYCGAVGEMLRVLRPGGYLVLTFPVGRKHQEEWLNDEIYSDQYKDNNLVFFEYRFDENDVNEMLAKIGGYTLIDLSIYWEKTDGATDGLMKMLRKRCRSKIYAEIRKSMLNFWAGLTLLDCTPSGFVMAKSCGIACLLLKKT